MRGLVVLALLSTATAARAAATAELVRDLGAADDVVAAEAAQKLGQSSDPGALSALEEALTLGVAPRVAAAILPGLGGRKDARATGLLVEYAHNRNADVRKQALAALARTDDARVAPALAAALGDSDAEVRAQAAQGIAERKDKSAEDRLIKLMEHKDPSAAAALAAIGTPALAHRLSEMLGQVPDEILCTALGQMLKRPDFPEPIRVEVVRTLSKVPGVDATTVLVEYVAATEKDKNRPSRLEAQKIVDERSRP